VTPAKPRNAGFRSDHQLVNLIKQQIENKGKLSLGFHQEKGRDFVALFFGLPNKRLPL